MTSKFGSVYYVAPEVLKADYTEKCDIWSLGVKLYELCTLRVPFDGKDMNMLCLKILGG